MVALSAKIGLSINSIVDASAEIGDSVVVWHWSQVRENVKIGQWTSIGQGVYVGPGVSIGKNCKIQNGAQIYEPAEVHDGVFIGPNVVLTNDRHPRALKHESGRPKTEADWQKVGVTVCQGASIGANVVCVAPIVVGAWSMIGAGTVLTKDVEPYALYSGSPGVQIGWVGRTGSRLVREGEGFLCPDTGDRYELSPAENQLARTIK